MTITINFASPWVLAFLGWAVVAGIGCFLTHREGGSMRLLGYIMSFLWPLVLIAIPIIQLYSFLRKTLG